MQHQSLKWQDVDSSNVKQLAYDNQSETLVVQFTNGNLYTYDGVDNEVFTSLAGASSVGRYLNQAIKGSYPYLKHENVETVIAYIDARREQSQF